MENAGKPPAVGPAGGDGTDGAARIWELLGGGALVAYPAKAEILRQGDPVNHLYGIQSGVVKIVNHQANGRSLLLCFMEPPGLLGDVELYRPGTAASCSAVAVGPVSLRRVPLDRAERAAASDSALARAIHLSLVGKMEAFTRAAARNLLYPLSARYASYLRGLLAGAGRGGDGLPLRLEETAGLLGTSVRHLQRVLRDFEAQGLVARQGRRLAVLDPAGLDRVEAAAEGADGGALS